MPLLETGDAELYYEVMGEGRPLVFSHGLGGSVDRVQEFVTGLPGVRAILYDNRSHGRTRVPPGAELSFNGMAGDIPMLLDHLSVRQAVVGGVSMGAGIALAFA